MRDIDLEPNRYRQVSADEARRAGPQEPVLTQAAPIVIAVLFCMGFGFWLASQELHAFFGWLIALAAEHFAGRSAG